MTNSDTRKIEPIEKSIGFGSSTLLVSLLLINTTSVVTPLKSEFLNSFEPMGTIIQDGTRILNPLQYSQGRIQENIKLLNSFRTLPKGWDGYNAMTPSAKLIEKAINIISEIEYQPRIFPMPDNSLQLEFTTNQGNELDVELSEEYILYYHPKTSAEGMLDNSLALNKILKTLFV